ncbi:MAG TPA: flavodoxin-dependent (E)-4-hydroxy-3-methylbut-2-enyl-diphosphate synthase [Nitrospirae bacterium]|nr:4-hydroxy-3-methylbut-2-en-1-yl diphosphate synthase [bacterium BMS3Bbin08]HDH51701.1 flavodoxin-dependent (E)-4-hydroxy-3-methylbut-2-enyl-diphosphate synthase [Nitrospirota bacterium]HDO26262.1 flavodoxin-dependent (E)-4-hydroxy-3-methylbut-2-enyl-diphosphate synthase [Nitrospirota bacterium]
MKKRMLTKQIKLGNVKIGGRAPVVVQSMTKTDTRDIASTVSQIKSLESAGCEVVRVAVLNSEAAQAIKHIRKKIKIPLIADIHFDHRLALQAMASGADGLRINPGNIGSKLKVKEVVSAARDRKIPIRIGVNAGSLEKKLLKKYKHPTARALVESAGRHIKILEDLKFTRIKVSLKASDVMRTVEAYRLFSKKFRYPLHIGISEAGPAFTGTIKSAVGLGILLSEGIGDTIRVSLTADPVEEVRVAYEILKSLHLRKKGPEIISCPTCGRCQIDIRGLAEKVEAKLSKMENPVKVAVMGCVVNGPGEAREADIGIAGGRGVGILFKHGKIVKTLKERELFSALMKEIKKL